MTGKTYTIYGHKGKQVRDHIHSRDLVDAFWQFFQNPHPGEVYNIGGSRHSNCSVLEAISLMQELTGNDVNYELSGNARWGDHIWWISDVRKFQEQYPAWTYCYDLKKIIQELVEAMQERTGASMPSAVVTLSKHVGCMSVWMRFNSISCSLSGSPPSNKSEGVRFLFGSN